MYRLEIRDKKRDYNAPEQMWFSTNGKIWKEYEIAIDLNQRCIGLLDTQDRQLSLQGRRIIFLQFSEKKENEKIFDVLVESSNDFSELETSGLKWSCIIINHSWFFRTLSWVDAIKFREQMTV